MIRSRQRREPSASRCALPTRYAAASIELLSEVALDALGQPPCARTARRPAACLSGETVQRRLDALARSLGAASMLRSGRRGSSRPRLVCLA